MGEWISALARGEWSASRPCRFTPKERAPGTHWIGGWAGLRAGLDNVEKKKFLNLPGLEHPPLGRPAHRLSLYRLYYQGSSLFGTLLFFWREMFIVWRGNKYNALKNIDILKESRTTQVRF
jgi:hypothetical protein